MTAAADRDDWQVCPKCGNMDGGCPFCGHGYIRTDAGAIKQLLRENEEKRGRSPSSMADVHWLAQHAQSLARLEAVAETAEALREAVEAVIDTFGDGYRDYNPPDHIIEEQRGTQRGAILLCARALAAAGSAAQGNSDG